MASPRTGRVFTTCLRSSASLLYRLLVLGVDGLDVLPDETFGVLEVLAALPEDVGRVEGRHRLDAALQVVPFTAVLGDAEVLVYDGLGRGTAQAEDNLRLNRLRLALQVDVAGFDLARPRLAVLHAPALLDRGPALDDVGDVDVSAGGGPNPPGVVGKLSPRGHQKAP